MVFLVMRTISTYGVINNDTQTIIAPLQTAQTVYYKVDTTYDDLNISISGYTTP
mgnify:CR=1 FL=1